MDLEQVQRLAQAFAQGVAFARGFTEMAQDAKDGEEDGHWGTIGGERGADGEKHGGRPVFISGSGTIKKGLSKSAQGKTLGQVFGKGGEFSSEGKKSKGESSEGKKHLWGKQRDADEWNRVHEINLKNKKENAEIRRKADKLMGVNEKDRRDATSKARELRQETKQIVANDLEPSVAKLKKALDANVPARVHDDLVDTHRLADQIGVMASKLSSLNSRYAENSKEPSAFVVSSHGHAATGTAEAVANLARRSAALAHDFDMPIEERTYDDARAASEIKDNLSRIRGLHQDLLDHIRRIQEPEKREEPQEDPLYAARGKVINGPATANAPASATRATPEQIAAKVRQATDRVQARMVKATRAVTERIDNGFVIQGPASEVERIRNGIYRIGTRLSSGEGMIGSACMAVEDAAYNGIIDQERAKSEVNKIRETADRYAEIARKLNKFMNQAKTMRVDTAVSARRIRQAEKTVNELYQSLDKQIDEINYSERKARGYVR